MIRELDIDDKESITKGEAPLQKIVFLMIISTALLFVFLPAFTFADKVPPAHSCTQPHRPFKFKTEAEVDAYKAQVESYRKCINDFVEEQNRAMQNHKDAANRAIEEYNFFVNTESRW
jgi:hypothetical protein